MKRPVFLIVAIVLAGIGATAWLLLGGGGRTGASLSDSGEESPAKQAASSAARPTSPIEARSSGAAAAGGAGASASKKLPPPPANGESTVTGRVIDAATRGAIAKAAIVLRHPEGDYAVTGESQGDGAFKLERVPGVIGARVFVNAPGYGPRVLREVHVPPHDKLDLGAIELVRGFPIRGRVVAPLGAPILGAQVDLLEARSSAPDAVQDLVQIFRDLRQDDESLDEVVTAADGTFAFAGAAPGSYVLAARKPEWQLRFSTPVAVVAGAAAPFVDLRLTEARRLRGIVKNEAGNPIAGALIAALEISQEETFIPKSQKAVTGADGRFAYSTFGAGQIAVVVQAAGYSGVSKSDLAAGAKEVEFVLKKAVRIEGRVFDRSTNKGLPGAVVVGFRLDTEAALEETRSGPDGAYLIEHGPAGQNVTVFAKLGGYTMAALADAMSANAPLNGLELLKQEEFGPGSTIHKDLAMVAGGSLSGRVVDDATNQGVAGSEITIRYETADFFGFSDQIKARSGTDGAFSVPSIGAGKVELSAHAEGYLAPKDVHPNDSEEPSPTSSDLVVTADVLPGAAVTGVVVRLHRGVEIDVIVNNPEGAPMSGASVSWVRPNEDLVDVFGPKKHQRTVVCDGGGKVRLKGLASQQGIVLAARHPDFPTGGHVTIDTVPPPERPVTIVLLRGASIAGMLLDVDGKPAPDLDLSYHPTQNDIARAFGEWTWAGRNVVTDAAGKFLIENLPPGPGKINLGSMTAGGNRDDTNGTEPQVCLDPAQGSLTLAAGKREQVTLHLVRTQSISGTVVDAEGKPVSNVTIDMGGYFGSQTGADGSYRVDGLPPGDYTVRVTGPSPSPTEPGELLTRTARAGATRVDFRFTK